MANVFAVIGGDSRSRYIAEELTHLGYTTQAFAVPGLPNSADTLRDVLRPTNYIILPMPALASDGTIRNSQALPLYPSDLLGDLPDHATIFGGKLDTVREMLSEKARVEDYSQWDALTIANAVPTAEGAIQLAMENLPTTIQGCRFLIVGAGRIGMCLAMKLQVLGANVTVTARKARDFARIRALGLTADETEQYALGLGQYDCVFNTVPAPVFTHEQLQTLNRDCLLMELASAPGGFPDSMERPILSGAALPGRVAPKTAGHLILDEIISFIRRETT